MRYCHDQAQAGERTKNTSAEVTKFQQRFIYDNNRHVGACVSLIVDSCQNLGYAPELIASLLICSSKSKQEI